MTQTTAWTLGGRASARTRSPVGRTPAPSHPRFVNMVDTNSTNVPSSSHPPPGRPDPAAAAVEAGGIGQWFSSRVASLAAFVAPYQGLANSLDQSSGPITDAMDVEAVDIRVQPSISMDPVPSALLVAIPLRRSVVVAPPSDAGPFTCGICTALEGATDRAGRFTTSQSLTNHVHSQHLLRDSPADYVSSRAFQQFRNEQKSWCCSS